MKHQFVYLCAIPSGFGAFLFFIERIASWRFFIVTSGAICGAIPEQDPRGIIIAQFGPPVPGGFNFPGL